MNLVLIKSSMLISFNEFLKKYKDLDKIKILEDKNLFYLWKPAWIPSSFGKKESVLDIMENNKFNKITDLTNWNKEKQKNNQSLSVQNLSQSFLDNQFNNFSKEQEYGLLNRLDNDTSWLLYFAKNQNIYNNFKEKQKNKEIEKTYYAKVDGKVNFQQKTISYPIMHKNKTKMIVIKADKDKKKGRWKLHFVETRIKSLWNNWLEVKIKKGIRHQIRVHLASIDLPIVWDKLYNPKSKNQKLELYSVGLSSEIDKK